MFGKKYKEEIEELKARNDFLQLQMDRLKEQHEKELEEYKEISRSNYQLKNLREELKELEERSRNLNIPIVEKESEPYVPTFKFEESNKTKDKLKECRQKQKEMIRNGEALYINKNNIDAYESYYAWKRIMRDGGKLTLRCFNAECNLIIDKVTINNYQKSKEKIHNAFDTINKLVDDYTEVYISGKYRDSKLYELDLAYQYLVEKEREKEILREQREREREEKALQKEINSKKKIIDKDIKHYEKIITELEKKLDHVQSESEKQEILAELNEQQEHKENKEKEIKELDYREANATAGYVYVISNIGAFGKDVVKIGVTRRLDPMERINELSSASVPFKFDVHALVFSDDAFKLESDLHKFFDKYRVNKVNLRKEFFNVPIDEIENKLEEYKNLTINFTKEAPAEEYYQSIELSNKGCL